MMRGIRRVLWGLVGIALAAFAFLMLPGVRNQAAPTSSGQPTVEIGGPFTLTGEDGKPFVSARLAGKPFAIFFGFTHCPDTCPTTLARLVKLRDEIGKGDDSLAILFVSVDPERDGPSELARYTALFGGPIIGLTGSPGAIDRVKRSFGVYSAKVPQPGADYSVDHTATVFLMDRNGKFAATLSPDEGDAVALAKLRRLVG